MGSQKKDDGKALRIFERKFITHIYGPILKPSEWRIRSNMEIEQILKEEYSVWNVESMRLRW